MSDLFYLFRNLIFFFATVMLLKYFIFMILAPLYPIKNELRKIKLYKKFGIKEQNLKVSVVVPAWNEEVGILKTINSIVRNTYHNVEIIVVNDGSKDRTEEVVKEYMASSENKVAIGTKTLKYIYQDNAGKGKALNTGIKNATGDIVLTVDADSALERQAISHLVKYFYDPEIKAVVGNVKVADNYTFIGFIQKLEYMFGFYFKRAHAVMGAEYIFGGACASFRREVFDQIGYFDEVNKTEDIEMSMRVRFNGMKSNYAEDVVCYTEGASTVTGLVNQRLRWKKGRFDTFIKYRRMFFSLHNLHNKPLAFFVLPYALLSDIQLFFEPIGIALIFSYSFISGDFLSLTLGIFFVFVIYLVNSLFHHEGIKPSLLILFPSSWVMFYFLVWVEYLALLHSLKMLLRGDNVEWQRWNRKGIGEV